MADASGPSGGGYDYVQDSSDSPTNPKLGEEWYQPDTDDVKTYDGGEWVDVKISDHSQLSGVSAGDHISPGGGLSFSAGALELLLSGYLTLDANGDLAIASGSIGQDRLAFDTATQAELNGHAGNETNPHNVTDDQTGAASALSNHAGNETNPHNVTDDQTGAASALSNHAWDSSAHHSKTPEYTDSDAVNAAYPNGRFRTTVYIASYSSVTVNVPTDPNPGIFQFVNTEAGDNGYTFGHLYWQQDTGQWRSIYTASNNSNVNDRNGDNSVTLANRTETAQEWYFSVISP